MRVPNRCFVLRDGEWHREAWVNRNEARTYCGIALGPISVRIRRIDTPEGAKYCGECVRLYAREMF